MEDKENTEAINKSKTVKTHVHNVYKEGDKSNLLCWYTNADSLLNKLSELKARLGSANRKPDIISIVEVKPKLARYKIAESELQLKGYNMTAVNLENDIGRGIVVYTRRSMKVNSLTVETQFQESLWLETRLKGGDKMIIGSIYKSPNSGQESEGQIREMIRDMSMKDYSHVLIIGDFNYNRINWEDSTTSGGVDSNEFLFIETLRDAYLYQHIVKPTRGRGTNLPSTLDLVMTNEENMIDSIEIVAPLGKSDHSVIEIK